MAMNKNVDIPSRAAAEAIRQLRGMEFRLALEEQHRFREATAERGRDLDREWRKVHPDPACWAGSPCPRFK